MRVLFQCCVAAKQASSYYYIRKPQSSYYISENHLSSHVKCLKSMGDILEAYDLSWLSKVVGLNPTMDNP